MFPRKSFPIPLHHYTALYTVVALDFLLCFFFKFRVNLPVAKNFSITDSLSSWLMALRNGVSLRNILCLIRPRMNSKACGGIRSIRQNSSWSVYMWEIRGNIFSHSSLCHAVCMLWSYLNNLINYIHWVFLST